MSASDTTTARGGGASLAVGRLLRLSLAPTALADVAAGAVLGAGAWPSGPAPFLLMLASACVYHGGMVLNDWADRAEDARVRPARPIPSGAISARAALALALALLAVGPSLATAVAPRAGLVLAGVAACAALYDLAGRGPWRGPLLLGLCRAGNLGTGLAFASTLAPWRPELLLAPAAYGLYVLVVSRLARIEDVMPGSAAAGGLRPAAWTAAAGAVLVGIGAVAGAIARHSEAIGGSFALAPVALGLAGAVGLWRAAPGLAGDAWTSGAVQRVAGMGLRRLLVASAALALGAWSVDGALVAILILCGYPLAFLLRKAFPPT